MEFMCYVAAFLFGLDLEKLKFPKQSVDGGVIDTTVRLFGSSTPTQIGTSSLGKNKETRTIDSTVAFYNEFVIKNLYLVKELEIEKHGHEVVTEFILKSVTVVLAFQVIPTSVESCMTILVDQYILTLLEETLAMLSHLEGKSVILFSKTLEYFYSEILSFFLVAKLLGAYKTLLICLSKKIEERSIGSTGFKAGLLFLIPTLSRQAKEVNTMLDYKERDLLLSSLYKIISSCQDKVLVYMTVAFKGIRPEEKNTLMLSFSLLSPGIILICNIMKNAVTPFSSQIIEDITALLKQSNAFCIKFDNSVKDRMRYSKNFFSEFFPSLPSLREARRHITMARILLRLRQYQINEDGIIETKAAEE